MVDNATIIKSLHKGVWPTIEGNLSWDANGSPKGNDQSRRVAGRQARAGLPARPSRATRRRSRSRTGRAGRPAAHASVHVLVQACILGLLTGGVYALMASGLTLAFGIMRVVNVAQGALIILGAYVSYTASSRRSGSTRSSSILIMTPFAFALGVGLQLAFLRPLRSDEREQLSLLVTWAVALGIEGVLSYLYKTTYRSTITSYANDSWSVGGYVISEVRVYGFCHVARDSDAALPDPRAQPVRAGGAGDVQNPVVGRAARRRSAARGGASASD